MGRLFRSDCSVPPASGSGSLLGPAIPPSFLLSSRRRFTGLPYTFAGAAASSITSMIIFWRGPSHAACARDLQAFLDLCRDLGFPLASEKLVLPTRCLQFLGVTLDSSLQEMRLPRDKPARLRDCLPAWRTRQKCTKRELLSQIGVLPFACAVVSPGRIFLRRLIDLSMTVPALAHHISLPAAARADVAWWVESLPSWNGRAFFPPSPRRHSGLLPTRAG